MMNFKYNDGGRAEAGYKGDTGDCVCRAIAIATGKPYQEVYDALITHQQSFRQTKRVKGSHPRTGVNRKIYETYLSTLGWQWTPTMAIGQGCTVHLKENELPAGRIIVRLSRHLAAVIEGVTHDTHDPSRNGTRCVYGFFSKV